MTPPPCYEGINGLGRRRDGRAAWYLKLLLHKGPDDIFAREAAARLLGQDEGGQIATIDLLGALQGLQRRSGGRTPRQTQRPLLWGAWL